MESMIKILLLSLISINPITYLKLQDQRFKYCEKNHIIINHDKQNYVIYYNYCSSSKKKIISNISDDIKTVSNLVLSYAESENLPSRECLPNKIIEIYDVSLDIINDKSRFRPANADKLW